MRNEKCERKLANRKQNRKPTPATEFDEEFAPRQDNRSRVEYSRGTNRGRGGASGHTHGREDEGKERKAAHPKWRNRSGGAEEGGNNWGDAGETPMANGEEGVGHKNERTERKGEKSRLALKE